MAIMIINSTSVDKLTFISLEDIYAHTKSDVINLFSRHAPLLLLIFVLLLFQTLISFAPIPTLPLAILQSVCILFSPIILLLLIHSSQDSKENFFSSAPELLGTILVMNFIINFGYRVLFFPGLIFSYWFLVTAYVAMYERKYLFSALARSRTLMDGYKIKSFLYRLFYFLPYVLALITMQLLLSRFASTTQLQGSTLSIVMLIYIFSTTIVTFLFIIWDVMFVGNFYYSLCLMKSDDITTTPINFKKMRIIRMIIVAVIFGLLVVVASSKLNTKTNNSSALSSQLKKLIY